MYSSRKAAAVRLPGAPSAAANIRNPGYRPAYSYWPGCQPLRAGTQSVSPPDNSFLIRKSPLHSHAKGESPRYHLYSPSPGPSDPSDSISFVLNEVSPREQLLSVHCSGSEATFHFRIPKPSSSQWTVLSGGAKNVLLFFPAFHLFPRPALSFIRFASQPQIFSDCSFLI